METINAEKKAALLELMEMGLTMIHLDARRDDVLVPSHLKINPCLRLNLSYKFHIPDLTIGDDGLGATLSFNRQPFYCRLPWDSIYGMTSETADGGFIWEESIPQDLREHMKRVLAAQVEQAQQQNGSGPAEEAGEEAPPRPRLQVVNGGAQSGGEEAPQPAAPRRGHLRLVK
ncbi:MAG: hypothetical protein GMKNLPBB_00575 [Myxococcota bacterium]|nr:hypothetical protein [Myxococcota bacterium]